MVGRSFSVSADLVESLGELALAARRGILMQNVLRDCLIDLLHRCLVSLGSGGLVACLASGVELLDHGLELGLEDPVAEILRLADLYALLRGFDVRHFVFPSFFSVINRGRLRGYAVRECSFAVI